MLLLALTYTEPDDHEFLVGLYQEYHRLMFSVAGKYTTNAHDKEDIVQEALVQLVKNVSRLRDRERCALVPFVVILIRNIAINYRKHLTIIQKHAQPWPEDAEILLPDNSPSLDEVVVLRDQISALKRIWPLLSEGDQLLLSGKYLMELSDAELAQIIGCKPDSIRMKLTRARRNALNKMREEDESHGKSEQTTGKL